jgi:hypothetical protein
MSLSNELPNQNTFKNKNFELNESNANNEKSLNDKATSSPSNNIRSMSTVVGDQITNELNKSPSKQLLKLKPTDQHKQLTSSASVDQDIIFSSAPSSPVISIDNLNNVLESSIDDDAKMIATKKSTPPQPIINKNSTSTNQTPNPIVASLNGSQGKELNTKEKHKKPWYSVSRIISTFFHLLLSLSFSRSNQIKSFNL